MIICEFVMPECDNRGNSKNDVHKHYRQKLVRNFGGYTAFRAQGQWFDRETQKTYNDFSLIYRVAVSEPADVIRLENFSMEFGRALEQETIFFSVIGAAEIVSLNEQSDKEARQAQWNEDAKYAIERRKRLNGRTAAE